MIYAKVGVHGRSALAARIFFDHYAGRMADGTNLDADGWFAADAPQPQATSRRPAAPAHPAMEPAVDTRPTRHRWRTPGEPDRPAGVCHLRPGR